MSGNEDQERSVQGECRASGAHDIGGQLDARLEENRVGSNPFNGLAAHQLDAAHLEPRWLGLKLLLLERARATRKARATEASIHADSRDEVHDGVRLECQYEDALRDLQ